MREILFRGFSLHDIETDELPIGISKGQEVHGKLVTAGKKIAWIVGEILDAGYEYIALEYWIPVDPETVGQYTGLKDKNGKEIYEGDICEAWSQGIKGIGEIKQRIDGLWIFYPAWQLNEFWGLMPSANGSTDVEIIGNNHDNPKYLDVCANESKHDEGKPRLALVPPSLVEAVGRVRTYGTQKYGSPDNWKQVEPWRYKDALMRHLCEYLRDPNSIDAESGLPHLEHLACNVAFLLEFDDQKKRGNRAQNL